MFISKQLLLLLCFNVGAFVAYAQNSVKNGQHKPTKGAGECSKRIPYHEAKSLYNDTESHGVTGYGQGARPHWNSTYNNDWVTVSVCCDGYQRNPSSGRCESSRNNCINGCFGGSCVNGICTCNQGWYAVEGVCEPICRRQCQQNAYCFAPDVCECKFGFERLSNGECRPSLCSPGFVMNKRLRKCDPFCVGGCVHGKCTSPGVCTCDQGYVNTQHDRGFCIPHCHNCPANAKCVSPERCICDPSFQMDYRNNRCVPTGSQQYSSPQDHNQQAGCGKIYCEGPCIDGDCIGYNMCSCNDGYVQDPQAPSGKRCKPTCSDGCPNGTCVGHNLCECKPGYVKDPGFRETQQCVPRSDY